MEFSFHCVGLHNHCVNIKHNCGCSKINCVKISDDCIFTHNEASKITKVATAVVV